MSCSCLDINEMSNKETCDFSKNLLYQLELIILNIKNN